jgi:3-phosphoshikimate 1-carboxyvinyltransferase
MQRELPTARRPLDAELSAVPSKSVTHRALVAAALAEGRSEILGALQSDDIAVTVAGLRQLGVAIKSCGEAAWQVDGVGAELPGGGDLQLRESGSSLRLLTAVASLGALPSQLDSEARLRERPIRPLLESLRQLGAATDPLDATKLPFRIGGVRFAGGPVSVEASRSSQFTSALLMLGPLLAGGIELELEGEPVSSAYVDVTVQLMRRFGAEVERLSNSRYRVAPSGYVAREFTVDGDHSAASYPFAAALIAGGRVRLTHLDAASLQPDSMLSREAERFGGACSSGPGWVEVRRVGPIPAFDLSLAVAPDLVPTVAAIAAFAEGPVTIREVAHLKLKESDRLRQMRDNLVRLGCPAESDGDQIRIDGTQARWRPAVVETAGDHRIAMAFALVALRVPGIRLDDADCVSKSFPSFWKFWSEMLA